MRAGSQGNIGRFEREAPIPLPNKSAQGASNIGPPCHTTRHAGPHRVVQKLNRDGSLGLGGLTDAVAIKSPSLNGSGTRPILSIMYSVMCGSLRLSSSPMRLGTQASKNNTLITWLTLGLSSLLLAGCASQPGGAAGDALLNASPWARANQLPVSHHANAAAQWHHQGLGARPNSDYMPTHHAGRAALAAYSEKGDSLVRLPVAVEGPPWGRLQFSWFINQLNPQADLADRHLDDAVVRVILQFDGDRSIFSGRDHRLSDLMQTLTGEPLPFATLMYVWDHRYPVGTVIPHARTERIKTLVVESGDARLGQWVDFERDVSADFQHAFGHAPERLQGLALMTDSNNTKHPARAWYGPLRWQGR